MQTLQRNKKFPEDPGESKELKLVRVDLCEEEGFPVIGDETLEKNKDLGHQVMIVDSGLLQVYVDLTG